MAYNWWCGQLRANRSAREAQAIGSDASAQMMLLTAFVLVIAFVAMTGMIARLAQLPELTRQSADRPIFLEGGALATGVQSALEDLNIIIDPEQDGTGMDTYTTAIDGAMAHLQTLESARGYRLRLEDRAPGLNPWCDDSSGLAVMSVQFALADTRTLISFTISWTVWDVDEDGIAGFIDPVNDVQVTSCVPP
jgi:hypothetical protein